MTNPLDNLSGPGKALKQEPPDANEFNGLKKSALIRLTDARNQDLSMESPSTLLTTQRTPSVWQLYDGMGTGLLTAI